MGAKLKSRWVPAALVTAGFVIVALVASQASIDTSVLIWTAVGVFGLVFGIATVGSARHADHVPSASAQAHARRVAETQEAVVRAAATPVLRAVPDDSGPADTAADLQALPAQALRVQALRALAVQDAPGAEEAIPRRAPKHSAELTV